MRWAVLVAAASAESTSLASLVALSVRDLYVAGQQQTAVFDQYDAAATPDEEPQPSAAPQEVAAAETDEVQPFRALLERDSRFDARRTVQPLLSVAAQSAKDADPVFSLYQQRLHELTAPPAPRPTLRDVAVPMDANAPMFQLPSVVMPPSVEEVAPLATEGRFDPVGDSVSWSAPSLGAAMTEPSVPVQNMNAMQTHSTKSKSAWASPSLFSAYQKHLKQAAVGESPSTDFLKRYRSEIAQLDK